MSKIIRFLLILALLVVVGVAAASQTVWASPAPVAPAAAAEKVNAAPAADFVECVGTVCNFVITDDGSGGCSGEHLIDSDYKNVCGVAKVTTTTGDDVKAYAKQGGLRLEFSSGSAVICFAAPKNGQIWFQPVKNQNDWFPMATNVLNGLACATVSESGFYEFRVIQD